MQRLGKNIGGYRGEGIDIQSILERIQRAAEIHGWSRDSFTIPNGSQLVAYRKKNHSAQKRFYLSTGIHGDEPAGPIAIMELLQENRWPANVDVWLCPCLNLTGFPLSTRENAMGIDLNRDYRHPQSPEVRTHVAWLKEQPNFDLSICLHEDWESNGFYLYEVNPDGHLSLAENVVQRVAQVCPIETAETADGWPVKNGVIRPQLNPLDRPQWPEAVFLITNKTRQSYTMETPSDFPLAIRVAAQKEAVAAALDFVAQTS